jgi:formylglycine-generating enzyme required for sulfatase activity
LKKIFIPILLLAFINALSAQEFTAYKQYIPGSNLYFKMVPIPAGSFTIGNAQKKIELREFWMGAFEVTRDEFDVFLKDEQTSQNSKLDAITRPSPQYVDLSWGMGKEGGYPANSMSQLSALMYCKWLYQKTKIFYRLPTEAEWEYACKAGSTTPYFFGNNVARLDQYAWYQKNSKNVYHKVGQKLSNPWGLYDILGNLLEWTLDHYIENSLETMPSKDPMMPANNAKYPKTLKGGSFMDNALQLKSAERFHSDPVWNKRDPQIPKSKWWLTEAKQVGFRLVRPSKQPTEEEVNQFFNNYIHL